MSTNKTHEANAALPVNAPFSGGLGEALGMAASIQRLWWRAAIRAQAEHWSFLTRRYEAASGLPIAFIESYPRGEFHAIGRDFAEAEFVEYANEVARCVDEGSKLAAEAATEIRRGAKAFTRDLAAQAVCP